MKEPQGIVAIVTNATGDVIATETDFIRQCPGGCALWEGQKYRAKQNVIRSAVRAYSSGVLLDALSSYLIDQIGEALRNKGGHKITYRAIGYPEDIADQVRQS